MGFLCNDFCSSTHSLANKFLALIHVLLISYLAIFTDHEDKINLVSGEPLFCHQNWFSYMHTTFGGQF